MNVQELYDRWIQHKLEDRDLTAELESIKGNDKEIYERFYTELSFGTAGLRGVLGAGTNRMNIYTVRRATQGFADYLNEVYEAPAIAIGYDSRIKSDLFAKEAAAVLAGNGVKVHLFTELVPTPAVSYAIRTLHCQAGINITASHNPSKYNGYKAYGQDGCQMTEAAADAVFAKIGKVDLFDGVKYLPFEEALASGKVEYISDRVMDEYLSCVKAQQVNADACKNSGLKLIYTPLNGAGNKPVRRILEMIGLEEVTVVPEQEYPDGNFPTCPYPNPEIKEALALAIALCKETDGDIVLATDPDSDRIGIAVKHEGDLRLLSGNEVGVLLLDYIAKARLAHHTMPEHPVTVKTIVTTKMIDVLAAHYGIEVVDVLTGFKYIGEFIGGLEKTGEEHRFIFGFEESYGYLAGTYVRDKDAVVGAMLVAEMASYYHKEGKTLIDVLEGLYKTHGMFYDTIDSFTFEGSDGMVKMKTIMDTLRTDGLQEIAGLAVVGLCDYETSQKTTKEGTAVLTLPKSNVLAYTLENLSTITIRPSGTEPKIKVYYSLKGENREALEGQKQRFYEEIKKILGI